MTISTELMFSSLFGRCCVISIQDFLYEFIMINLINVSVCLNEHLVAWRYIFSHVTHESFHCNHNYSTEYKTFVLSEKAGSLIHICLLRLGGVFVVAGQELSRGDGVWINLEISRKELYQI